MCHTRSCLILIHRTLRAIKAMKKKIKNPTMENERQINISNEKKAHRVYETRRKRISARAETNENDMVMQ